VYTIRGTTDPADWGELPTANDSIWNAAICAWKANGYRLPTEAEWEYAARGATDTVDYLYSGSDDIDAVAWYEGNNIPFYGPKAAGNKEANALGLYDMSGNIFEWCWDWLSNSYYSESTASNPKGPESGFNRVTRGGNWNFKAAWCRVANRAADKPHSSDYNIGFRLCRADP